jgi:hypothetical protein
MRRLLAALVLVLLLAPEASAQTDGEHELRNRPTQAEIAAQASFPASYLLTLYMMQLASAGSPPSQSDIDEATRQYLTNGAAVTSVPNGGPGSDYFRNGAAVTGVPSSGPGAAYFQNGAEALAYYAPRGAPAEEATGEADAGHVAPTASASPEIEDAGLQPPTAAAESAPAVVAMPMPSSPACPTCATFEQIEAALAIANSYQTPSPPAVSSCADPVALVAISRPSETVPAAPTEPAVSCPSGPSPLSRIGTVLGGALLGGLAVVLWSRPRSLRIQPHHR